MNLTLLEQPQHKEHAMRRVILTGMILAGLGLDFSGWLARPTMGAELETRSAPQTQLYIRTLPQGAQVKVDGQSQGNSPLLISMPPEVATVVIEVQLDGFTPEQREILVRGGRITRVELKLRKKPRTGSLPAAEGMVDAKLGRLDLRLVPTRGESTAEVDEESAADSRPEERLRLSPSQIDQYTTQLNEEGPFVGRDRGDPLAWFQLHCEAHPELITADHQGRRFILLANRPTQTMLAIGWSTGPWRLRKVQAELDGRGMLAVGIEMNQAGGERMSELTTAYRGFRMAMLVDDQVVSMPMIQGRIGQRIQISGAFTPQFVEELAQVLRSRVVPPSPLETSAARPRHFVRLVVSSDAMTFQGEPVTWDQLPELLQQVPDPAHTVLEVAIDSDQLPVGRRQEAVTRAAVLARQSGLEYTSDIGVHPLGSTGTPSETPATAGRRAAGGGDSRDREVVDTTRQARPALAQIRNMSQALRAYHLDTGQYPTTEQGLQALVTRPSAMVESQSRWQGPYLKGPVPLDPWLQPYRYRSPAPHQSNSFDLWSAGPDGKDGTDDDCRQE
jgi:type II secretion system protein G